MFQRSPKKSAVAWRSTCKDLCSLNLSNQGNYPIEIWVSASILSTATSIKFRPSEDSELENLRSLDCKKRFTNFIKEKLKRKVFLLLKKSNFSRLEMVKICMPCLFCMSWLNLWYHLVGILLWAQSSPWMPTCYCCINYPPQIKQQGFGTLPCCGCQTTSALGHSTQFGAIRMLLVIPTYFCS